MKLQADLTTFAGLSAPGVILRLRKLTFDFDNSECRIKLGITTIDDAGAVEISDMTKTYIISGSTWDNQVMPALKGQGNSVFQRIRTFVKNQLGVSSIDLDPEEDI